MAKKANGLDWRISPPRPSIDPATRQRQIAGAKERAAADRELAARLEEQLTVTGTDKKRFSAGKNSGVFYLIPNFDCVDGLVVNSETPCDRFIDGGSAYSFRRRMHLPLPAGYASLYPYHDIALNNGQLASEGFLSHGMFVELGNTDPSDVTAVAAASEAILRIPSPKTVSEADTFQRRLLSGFDIQGRRVSNKVAATVGTTYLFRNIAYKATGVDLHGDPTKAGWKFAFMQFDKREDITVIFRIERKEEDGRLLISWRQLARTSSPVLKFKAVKASDKDGH